MSSAVLVHTKGRGFSTAVTGADLTVRQSASSERPGPRFGYAVGQSWPEPLLPDRRPS